MKKLYLFAALAAMLAACSENDLTAEKQVVQQNAEEGAVNFDVYTSRTTTRAGWSGSATTDELKKTSADTDLGKSGFGVFGYYTDGEPYSAITKPNFFYNQQVAWDASKNVFMYTPVKYWPNEFGGDAKSDQVDRLTLFAYLPWVEVDPLTGVAKPETNTSASDKQKNAKDPTTNITGMTRNTATGDPFIKYVSTMAPKNSVDLCYGVAAATFTSSNSAVNQNNIEKGKPYIDVVKPGTDVNSKIKFDFKHATAQMRVTIDAHVNDQTKDKPATTVQTDYTRIWVRSVTFTGITHKGSLCLNSTADSPEWYDINGSGKITSGSLTVFDGRKDGKEANDVASNETPATLNPVIIQSKPYSLDKNNNNKIKKGDDQPELGVTETTVNLFDGTCSGSDIQPVFVIPTKEKMRVTIVYDVETVDPNLPYYLSDGNTPGSTIQNTIYKDIETFGEIKAGYCYTLNLHLGMRTVDFEAEVTPWQYYGADVDLPSNMQTFAAGTTPDPKLTLPADVTEYQFAVSGLEVNNSVTVTPSVFGGTATATPVNGTGISIVTISGITKNTEVKDKSANITVSDASSNTVMITATQQAAPLGMVVQSASNKSVVFGKTTTSTWDEVVTAPTDPDKFKVWLNGMLMTVVNKGSTTDLGTVDADNKVHFGYNGGTATLKFKNNLKAGDIITVWVKPGDAAEESVTAKIAGFSFAPGTCELTYYNEAKHYDSYAVTYYGPGTATYNWTIKSGSATGVASVEADNGKITTLEAGETIIQATVTEETISNAEKEGWYFTSLTKTEEYPLKVNLQAVKVEHPDFSITAGTPAAGSTFGDAVSSAFSFKGAKDDQVVDDVASIDYEVTKVILGETTVYPATIEVDSSSKKLKVVSSSSSLPSGSYKVTIKATKSAGTKYDAKDDEREISFTVG